MNHFLMRIQSNQSAPTNEKQEVGISTDPDTFFVQMDAGYEL